jgi:hypothetical protein
MYEYGPIKDFDNYVIRNDGVVIKISDKRELKCSPDADGYVRVDLRNEGKRKTFLLHRLLGKAFIDGEDATHNEIDHIDQNKANNSLDNLRWATRSEQNINRQTRPSNTGELNIYLRKSNTYQVVIQRNNKVIYRKSFKTLPEAIIARDDFTEKLKNYSL